jgi:hypothetical protein
MPWSSGKGEDSCPRGRDFESRPRCRDHLSCTINLDQKHESIIVEKKPGTVACAVILQRGGWSLWMVGL